MKRSTFFLLASLGCGSVFSQATFDDLTQFNRDSVLAKRCADLGEKAVMVTACKGFALTKPSSQMTDSAAANVPKRPGKRLDVEPDILITILSAWGSPEDPSAEVSMNDAVRVMNKGDSFQGWKLTSLDPYAAKFQSPKGTVKTISYRTPPRPTASPLPASATAGFPPGTPFPVPGPAPLPGQGIGVPALAPPGQFPGTGNQSPVLIPPMSR